MECFKCFAMDQLNVNYFVFSLFSLIVRSFYLIEFLFMLLAGIFHLLSTARCSTGLNGSDPEQIDHRG